MIALHIKDELAKIDGVGDVQQFGGGNYSMRVWLDPDKVAARGLDRDGDIANAIREQNVQVAAGQLGSSCRSVRHVSDGSTKPNFQIAVNTKGRLVDEEDFGNIIVRTGNERTDHAAARCRARGTRFRQLRAARDAQQPRRRSAFGIFQRPGSNAIAISDAVRAKMAELKKSHFPTASTITILRTIRPCSCAARSKRRAAHADRSDSACRHRCDRVPSNMARVDHSTCSPCPSR